VSDPPGKGKEEWKARGGNCGGGEKMFLRRTVGKVRGRGKAVGIGWAGMEVTEAFKKHKKRRSWASWKFHYNTMMRNNEGEILPGGSLVTKT